MRRVQKRLDEIHSFGRKVTERKKKEKYGMSQIYPVGISETSTDPCLETHLLRGLISRLCWQNYLDSQRFYFYLLVLIGPARFTKSFSQRSAFLSDCSKCLSFLRTLRFFSTKECLSWTTEKCRSLSNRRVGLRFELNCQLDCSSISLPTTYME